MSAAIETLLQALRQKDCSLRKDFASAVGDYDQWLAEQTAQAWDRLRSLSVASDFELATLSEDKVSHEHLRRCRACP